jgi:anti-sigma factor RsiW
MISEHPAEIVLLDFVEGVLAGDESQSVRRHIASCRPCRRTLAEISSTIDDLDRLPTAELAADAFPTRGRRVRRTLARLLPYALAAVALLAALFFWARPGTTSGTPPRQGSLPLFTTLRVNVTPTRVRSLLQSLHVRVTADRSGLVVLVRNAEEYELSVETLDPFRADIGTIGVPTEVSVVTAGGAAVGQPTLAQVK